MRHKINRLKFKQGQDSNKRLLKKLLINFIKYGKIETTHKRGQILKSEIDKLVSKAIKNRSSDKNSLLSKIGNQHVVDHLLSEVSKFSKNRVGGGYVSLKKVGFRAGDSATVSRLSWTDTVAAMINIKPKKVNVKENDKTNPTNKTS